MNEPDARPSHDRGNANVPLAILDALPGAVFASDAAGAITYFNAAAVDLWGDAPTAAQRFSGGVLFTMSGVPLAPEASPLARALAESRAIGDEMVIERNDGTRRAVHIDVALIKDKQGHVRGATALLTEIGRIKQGGLSPDAAAIAVRRLAAIVESSDDAIIAKDLDGIITDFNQGAERLFGYQAGEAIGSPVTILMPDDRLDEEPRILERIRRGERIDHFETTRRRKDGTVFDISLTISPIRAPDGTIVGASKIARDISERRRAEERQQLLLREMNHRIKNLFALSASLVNLTARQVTTPQELAERVGARLVALARAHDLTLPQGGSAATTLHALATAIVAPFLSSDEEAKRRVSISGEDVRVSGAAVTSLALLIHEFATNATKYGALSTSAGQIHIRSAIEGDTVLLDWTEHGAPAVDSGVKEGFGSILVRATARGQLGGGLTRHFQADGLTIHLTMSTVRLGAI